MYFHLFKVYVSWPVPTATNNNSSFFFYPLMDDKNLIIEAKVVKVLFALQILDSIQALLHQHVVFC